MHEFSLTEKILNIVLKEAEAHHVRQVKKVTIIVGDLSGVVNDSVEMYFRIIAEGTMAEAAVLEFIREKARLYCETCKVEYIKTDRDFLCPTCGNLGRLTDIGRECIVQNIEVE
jgi:hydrogenase nickel incorporation protein HypA/HybF